MDVDCWAGRWPPMLEVAVHLAVAGDVYRGCLFVLSFFSRDAFDAIWDLIESVSEGFPTYSYNR